MKRRVSINKASLSSVIELPKVAGHFLKNRPCFAVRVCYCLSFVSESETSLFWHQRTCHSRRWNTWCEMHFLRMVALSCPWRELCSLNFQFNISIFPRFPLFCSPFKIALSDESMSWKRRRNWGIFFFFFLPVFVIDNLNQKGRIMKVRHTFRPLFFKMPAMHWAGYDAHSEYPKTDDA